MVKILLFKDITCYSLAIVTRDEANIVVTFIRKYSRIFSSN